VIPRLLAWGATTLLPPAVVLVVAVLAWDRTCVAFELKPYLMPRPHQVWDAAIQPERRLFAATLRTAAAAVCGLALSLVAGTLAALAFAGQVWVRRALFPYTIVFQTMPVVAIAPLVILWSGTGFRSIVIVAFVISVFPVVGNATQGLVRVDAKMLELFACYRASRMKLLFKLRLPLAIPYIVAGARVASGLSVIGAIVGEFVAGHGVKDYGLGYLIQVTSSQSNTPALFASVAASTTLGLTWLALSNAIGNAVLSRYAPDQRES